MLLPCIHGESYPFVVLWKGHCSSTSDSINVSIEPKEDTCEPSIESLTSNPSTDLKKTLAINEKALATISFRDASFQEDPHEIE